MRLVALVIILLLLASGADAAFITSVDPQDDANWLPVTIETSEAFQPVNGVYADVIGKGAPAQLTTAPFQFWLQRTMEQRPGRFWWIEMRIVLFGSPIGGGVNQFLLLPEEATAPSLVLRPQVGFYPPLTPPNDRVDWARFWTVDDGTPRDALAITQFRNGIPEPGTATLAIFAAIAVQVRRRG